MTLRLPVRTGPRAPRFPLAGDDDALGASLWALVARAVEARQAPPAAFVFRPDVVHLVDVRPALPTPRVLPRLLGSLAGVEDAEALALVGVLTRRKRGLPAWRYGVAFLEWPDGRWWLAHRRVLDQGDPFIPEFDVEVQRAIDHLPRPGGLGGWFTRSRMEDLHATIAPGEPPGLVN